MPLLLLCCLHSVMLFFSFRNRSPTTATPFYIREKPVSRTRSPVFPVVAFSEFLSQLLNALLVEFRALLLCQLKELQIPLFFFSLFVSVYVEREMMAALLLKVVSLMLNSAHTLKHSNTARTGKEEWGFKGWCLFLRRYGSLLHM